MATVQHPSAQNDPGWNYTYSFDSMGRLGGMVDNQATPVTWVQNVIYGPSDELQQIRINSGPGGNRGY